MNLQPYTPAMQSIKKVFFILLMLMSCSIVSGANSIAPPNAITGAEIVVGAEIYKIDPTLNATNLVTENPATFIRLEVDSNSAPFVWYRYTVELKVAPILEDGSEATASTVKMSVEYNPEGNTGNFIDLSLKKLAGRYGATVAVLNITTEYVESGTTTTVTPENVTLSLDYTADKYYELSTNAITVSEEEIPATNPCDLLLKWNKVTGAKEYELEWTWIDNYGDATLELAANAIDLSERDFQLNNTRVQLKDEDSGFVSVQMQYEIPLVYARGYLVYRVRAVGRFLDDTSIPYYGEWSQVGTENSTIQNWGDRYKIQETHEKEKNWQFQASYAEEGKKKEVVSYFDGTLRNRQTVTKINSDDNAIVGEVIYDNQGRPAVEVLPVPAGDDKIKFYNDFNRNEEDVKYTHNDFDWDKADDCEIDLSGMSNNTSGASKYYSGNNTVQNNFQDYVPDALNFPFSQIEYTPDNTGRIRRKGGVGVQHQLGTGSEMKYYYSQPGSSFEINRLFGREVGKLNHYKKNVVLDPNGQASVSYIDPQGRTIATALAGGNPQEADGTAILEGLEDEEDINNELHGLISSNLLENNDAYATGRYGTTQDGFRHYRQFTIEDNFTQVTSTYTLNNAEEFTFLECPQTFPYEYDLTLAVGDDCGDIARSTNDRLITGVNFSFPITFSEGEYTSVKDLIVSQEALEEHWNTFLVNAQSECLLTIEDFALVTFDCATIDCEVVSQGMTSYIVDRLTTVYGTGGFTVSGDVITVTETDSEIAAEMEAYITGLEGSFEIVEEFCEEKTRCYINEQTLLADMSPHGQYGDVSFDFEDTNGDGELNGEEFTLSTISTALSIFNDGSGGTPNGLYHNQNQSTTGNNWRKPIFNYKDSEDSADAKIIVTNTGNDDEGNTIWNPEVLFVDEDGDGNNDIQPLPNPVTGEHEILPQYLANVADFIAAWNPYWAHSLLEYHPEYCYLEYSQAMCNVAENEQSVYGFEDYLRSVTTYSFAQSEGLIGSGFLQILNADPYFNNQYASENDSSINYAQLRYAIMNEALSKNYDGLGDYIIDNDNDEVFGMLSYSYAVEAFGSLMNQDNIASLPDSASALYGSAAIGSLTTEEKDSLWIQYMNNYIGLRAKIYDAFISIHASNSGCYNECLLADIIDQDVIELGEDYNIDIASGSGSFTDPLVSYLDVLFSTSDVATVIQNELNPPNVTLCNSSSSELYAEKVKRFPLSTYLYNATILNEDSETINSNDENYYDITGKCKSQADLEIFLRGFFDERNGLGSITSSLEYGSTYFTIDLFENLGGVEEETPTLSGEIIGSKLNILISGVANLKCNTPITIELPAGSGLTWGSYGSSWQFVDNVGITELYFDPTIEEVERYHFEVLGTINQGGTTKEYVFKGNTCAKLNDCLETCGDDCDRPYTIAAKNDLVNLLNRIHNDNNLNTTSNINIGSYNEYTGSFIPQFYNVPPNPLYRFNSEGQLHFSFHNPSTGSLIFKMNGDYSNANSFIDEFLDVRFELETMSTNGPAHNIVLVYRTLSGNVIEDQGVLEYTQHVLLDVCLEDPEYFLTFILRKEISETSNPSSRLLSKDIVFSIPNKTYAKYELIDLDFSVAFGNSDYIDNGDLNPVDFNIANTNLSINLNGELFNQTLNNLEIEAISGLGGVNQEFHCFDTDSPINRPLENDLSHQGKYPASFDISHLDYTINGHNKIFPFNEGMGLPAAIVEDPTNGEEPTIMQSINAIGTMANPQPFINWISPFNDVDNKALSITVNSPFFTCSQKNPRWQDTFTMSFDDGVNIDFGAKLRLNGELNLIENQPNQGDAFYFGNIARLNYLDPSNNDVLYSLIVGAQTSIDFEEPTGETCPCVVQTVKPVSCDDKWETFTQYFGFEEVTYNNGPADSPATYTVVESTQNVSGVQLPEPFTKEFFCGMNYAHITDTYIHYLETLGVDSVSHPFYLTIGAFGDTNLNYGFDDPLTAEHEMELVINGFVGTPLVDGLPSPQWKDYVDNYIMENSPCIPAPMFPEVEINVEVDPTPCNEIIESITQAYAQDSYNEYLAQLKADFEQAYITGAIETVQETYKSVYADKQYQYTLYYYDQAGNLTQTVPPEGAKRLGDGLELAEKEALNNQINIDKENPELPPVAALPEHTYKTNYKYNTLNQLVWQNTPDGGETRFAYDDLGRIIASQNAKQKEESTFTMSNNYPVLNFQEDILNTFDFGSNGKNVTRINNSGWRGANGTDIVQGNVSVQRTIKGPIETNYYTALGLSYSNSDYNHAAKSAYGFYAYYNSRQGIRRLYTYYNGQLQLITGSNESYAIDDVLKIERIGSTIKYYKNDIEVRSVNEFVANSPAMRLELGMYRLGTKIYDIQLINEIEEQGEAFSYTNYDGLGRIVEAGEIYTNESYILNGGSYYISDDGRLINKTNGFSGPIESKVNYFGSIFIKKVEITNTIYDKMISGKETLFEDYAYNDRNRVTAVLYLEEKVPFEPSKFNFNNAIYYDYDIHGNVKELITEINDKQLRDWNQHYKKVQYEYDLISGNVNQVTYQKKQRDQFIHRYEYDDDNRIVNAQTSNDGEIWETDAKYQYYEHGPLARVLTGDKEVQAMDYVYTLQGWLKGVNGEQLNGNDVGNDTGLVTARDAFAYTLSYFNNDYTARLATNPFTNSETHNSANPGLKNGNIRGMTTAIMDTDENPLNIAFNTYGYDQLNRIVSMQNMESTPLGGTPSINGVEAKYSYDRNGNLQTLHRSAKTDAGIIKSMDELTYKYYDIAGQPSNRLQIVNDDVPDNTFEAVDIDNHQKDYTYDQIGQLTSDVDENIKKINWRVDGKVKSIIKTDGQEITFTYDGLGNRLSKHNLTEQKTTYYFRDAQGNVLSVYNQLPSRSAPYILKEQHIYGSSRVGLQQPELSLVGIGATTVEKGNTFNRIVGDKRYELSNHLGNVLEVINDKKLPNLVSGSFTYFKPDAIVYNDYYPFGMLLPNRNGSNDSYRYGFNGKEVDNEVKGVGVQYDYGFRIYDARLGKFLSQDPLFKTYPFYTPYQFAGNSPIRFIDLDGLEQADNFSNFSLRDWLEWAFGYDTIDGISEKERTQEGRDRNDRNFEKRKKVAVYAAKIEKVTQTSKEIGDFVLPVELYEQITTGKNLDGTEATPGEIAFNVLTIIPFAKLLKGGKVVVKHGDKFIEISEDVAQYVLKNMKHKPCGCFVSGTKVLAEDGYIDINSISIGDKVWSYNTETGRVELKSVLYTYTTYFSQTFKIYLKGEIIEATHEHPFFVDGIWLKAEELKVGHNLRREDGSYSAIEKIEVLNYDEDIPVYNLTVKDNSNYFVSNQTILTHNGDPCSTLVKKAKLLNGKELIVDDAKSYEQARNIALELVGDLSGDKGKKVIGRLQKSIGNGKTVGRQSKDGLVRWRLDFDPEKGVHINVEDFRGGKGKKALKFAIKFEGNEETFRALLKVLNK